MPRSSHFAVALLIALSAVPGCECSSADSTAKAGAGAAATPADPDRHALAGSWSGHVMTVSYGLVAGSISIDAEGNGSGVVTARGMTFSRSVSIDAWDGSHLQVRVGGVAYTIPARLTGAQLDADLPMVGEISLNRK